MRATVMYGAGDVRIENVPDPSIVEPTDAILARHPRLHLRQRPVAVQRRWSRARPARRMGHEAIGVVEDVGSRRPHAQARRPRRHAVRDLRRHLRVLPRGAAHRVRARRLLRQQRHRTARRPRRCASPTPTARSTRSPVGEDDALMPSLLTLSDVMGTGHHAAVVAQVAPGKRWPSSATAPSACAA